MLETITSQFKPHLLKTVRDGASFLSATYAASKAPYFVEWLGQPLSESGMMACSGINTLTVGTARLLCQTDDPSKKSYYQSVATIGGLGAGVILATAIAKPLSERFGIVINTYAAAKIALFNLAAKVGMYGIYLLALRVYHLFCLPSFQDGDDLDTFSDGTIGKYKAHFETKAGAWDALSLKQQAAFNVRLYKKEQEMVAFTQFDTSGEKLTPEELQAFVDSLEGEVLSSEQAQVFFEYGAKPPSKKGALPRLNPQEVTLKDLSDGQVCWYHQAFTRETPDLSDAQYQAFGERFYHLHLSPPSEKFLVNFPVPESSEDLSEEQCDYLIEFYAHYPAEFQVRTLSEQAILSAIFSYRGLESSLRDPTLHEMGQLRKGALKAFRLRYAANPDLWKHQDLEFQKAFNVQLQEKGLVPLPIEPSHPFLRTLGLVAFIVGVRYLESYLSQVDGGATEEVAQACLPAWYHNVYTAIELVALKVIFDPLVNGLWSVGRRVYGRLKFSPFETVEDLEKLSIDKVEKLREHLEATPSAWNALTLKKQAIFNAYLAKKRMAIIPFTKLDFASDRLTPIEARVFFGYIKSNGTRV